MTSPACIATSPATTESAERMTHNSTPLPPTLLRFSLAAALGYAAYAMCRAPVLPLYARQLGAGPELVGLVAGASTLTGVVLKLPAGAISDGHRPPRGVDRRRHFIRADAARVSVDDARRADSVALRPWQRDCAVQPDRLRGSVRHGADGGTGPLAWDVFGDSRNGAGSGTGISRDGCLATPASQ